MKITPFYFALLAGLVVLGGCNKKNDESEPVTQQPATAKNLVQQPVQTADRNSVEKHIVTLAGNKITYEQFDSNEKFFQDINAIAKTYAEKSEIDEGSADDNVSVTLKSITDNLFEIQLHSEHYGGAHPSILNTYEYHSKSPYKKLTANDIIIQDKIKDFADFVIERHKNSLELEKDDGGLLSCIESITNDILAEKINSGMFSIDNKSFTVYYDLPHMCQAADGPSVDWTSAQPYLTDKFKTEVEKFSKE